MQITAIKTLLRLLPVLPASLVLTACLSSQPQDWPAELPPRQQFVVAYQQDPANQKLQSLAAYLGWIRSFYEGTVVYPTGWLDIQARLLADADPDARAELAAELEALGVAIGAEWAKENRNRLIDNRLLALWGSVLQLAEAQGRQADSIALIARDVDRLFAGDLAKDDIVEGRYADDLGLEVFSSF